MEQCRQKYGELLKDMIEFTGSAEHENLFCMTMDYFCKSVLIRRYMYELY
jgi:hypothetical protein